MTRARIALVGTGWWATAAHLPAIQENHAAELVGLCDRDTGRLAAAADAFGVPPARRFADHRELLATARPDAVVIATPHATHFSLGTDCLAAGCHLLIEKPMALTAREAEGLMAAARVVGREIVVGYPWNYTDFAQKARELFLSGELGAAQFVQAIFHSYHADLLAGATRSGGPYYPVHGPTSAYADPKLSGGGHGHLQLTHVAGLLAFVAGLRVHRVIGLMRHHGLAVDLVDALTVEFEGGAIGMVGGTSNGQLRRAGIQLYAERGALEIDALAGKLTLLRHGGAAEVFESQESVYPKGAPVDNLIEIVHGGQNRCPATVGALTVELLDAAYRSARNDGAPVTRASLYEEERENP